MRYLAQTQLNNIYKCVCSSLLHAERYKLAKHENMKNYAKLFQIRRMFNKADKNKDGKLTPEEWRQVLNASGVPTTMWVGFFSFKIKKEILFQLPFFIFCFLLKQYAQLQSLKLILPWTTTICQWKNISTATLWRRVQHSAQLCTFSLFPPPAEMMYWCIIML